MKEEKKSCNLGCPCCYSRRALAATERMQMQQNLLKSVMRSPISIMLPHAKPGTPSLEQLLKKLREPEPLWYRDPGASERRVEELLSVSESFDPIWVDYEDKTVFFDESEKLIPTPKKRVWYRQTPQIRGRTFGFIFKE